jgi:Lipase (class 3)
MAEMADNIWQASGEEILQLLQVPELNDFDFMVVGHSLGAGTACLLTVKIFHEDLLPQRNVRCFAFAPPPTLSTGVEAALLPPRVKKAIDSTIAYIHDADCVPFLSVRSVQRLVALFKAVDKNTEHIWAYRRFLMFWEWEAIPKAIIHDVKAADDLFDSGNNATVLEIPASFVVWMKNNFTGSRFDAFGCSPKDLARINLQVSQDMLTDHLVEPYEDCFDNLAVGEDRHHRDDTINFNSVLD